ncbi:MAG: 4Fe-4S dicluster domain-containing protein [Candidatus Firestonebacteria bacterium]|nr:4Fe-4S dicluster domain-containing protein [Candidatus Firestonebacteria bacterium]
MTRVNAELLKTVEASGEFNAVACMNCGTCTALCPLGLTNLPREIFRDVVLGLEEKVLANVETVFSCLLCRMCQVNCPAEVKIADNVRTLRVHLNKTLHHL